MIPRGRVAAGAAIVLSLAAAGCLTASPQSRVQTDLDEVRKQMFEVQRDTAAILSRMAALDEKLSKQEGASPIRWADLQALLQTLSDEVRSLGARLDDNTARMGSLSRDMAAARDQYRALDAKMSTLLAARGSAAPVGGGVPIPVPEAVAPLIPSEAPPITGAPQVEPAAPRGAAPAAPDDEAAQEEAFRAPYSEYTRGNYDLALAGFQEFLKRYPGSPLAASAQYYTGECLFSQQRYQEAADAFGRTVAEHPDSDKIAASYLKKGLSLLALKQTAQGVVQLQHVIESFPRSEEARIAADRLRQLGLRDR